jgi:hypothetical protein
MTKPAILDPATRDGAQYVLLKLGQYRFHVSGGSVHIEVWGYHEELTQIKIRKIRLDGYKVPDLKKARLEEWANQKSSFQTKFKLVIDSLVWAEKVLTQGGPRSLVEKILEQHFGARNVDPLESIKPKIKSVLDGLKQTTQTNPLPIVDGVTALGSQGEGLIQYTTDADVASNHRDRFNASEDTMLVSALRTGNAGDGGEFNPEHHANQPAEKNPDQCGAEGRRRGEENRRLLLRPRPGQLPFPLFECSVVTA